MKRTAVFALMIALALLSGCGTKAEETAVKNFQSALLQAQNVSFGADIRAEFDSKTEAYTLNYAKDADGAVIEVVKPELIAGIKAHVNAGSSSLEYDGATLDTGPLSANGLTPISSLPELTAAISGGHLDMVWKEGSATVAQITPKDGLTVTVWFDENTTPYHAELQSTGKVLVYCDIINFTFS